MSTPHPVESPSAQKGSAPTTVPHRVDSVGLSESAEMMIKYAPVASYPVMIKNGGFTHSVSLNQYCGTLEALFPAPEGSKVVVERQQRTAALSEPERAEKIRRMNSIKSNMNYRLACIEEAIAVSSKIVEAWEKFGPALGVKKCSDDIVRVLSYWHEHPGVTALPGAMDY